MRSYLAAVLFGSISFDLLHFNILGCSALQTNHGLKSSNRSLKPLTFAGMKPTKDSIEENLVQRRKFLLQTGGILAILNSGDGFHCATRPPSASAYTPDSDPLRESLYLMSRVQEASVQQQRLIANGKLQEELKTKMTLSLRLVERSYRLVDQINFASRFISSDNSEDLVIAVAAGNEAADALQSAIDYVREDLQSGPIGKDQKEFLTEAMIETREKLFVFLSYMPPQKLAEARIRVEEENVKNREEFDGDADAGVFNPVKLPWK